MTIEEEKNDIRGYAETDDRTSITILSNTPIEDLIVIRDYHQFSIEKHTKRLAEIEQEINSRTSNPPSL